MNDEELAAKLCAYDGPLFGILPMQPGQRLAREGILAAAFAAIREECAKELAHWREAAASVGETDGHGMAETIKELRCITQPAKAQEGA
jgi:hypothetical protein